MLDRRAAACSSTSASAPTSPARKRLRADDPRGPLRGRAGGGAPAGRERRADHRRQHGRGDARHRPRRWSAS
ncbi:MAG: hypothetical protein MZW92_66400 [Comamonadaceae bacterium]|nr:hypothetical protein [Comamonadaceae bacterium]